MAAGYFPGITNLMGRPQGGAGMLDMQMGADGSYGLPDPSQANTGGILSGLFGPGPHPVLNWLGDRSATLTGLGLAMLLAPNAKAGYEGAMNALASGRQVDFARQQARQKQEAEARQQAALTKMLQTYGLDTSLAGVPEIAAQAIGQRLKPQEPAGLVNAGDGYLYDPNKGEWISSPGAGRTASRNPVVADFYDPQNNAVVKRQWNAATGQWEDVGFGKPPTGMIMESTPDGGFRVTTGAPMGGRMTESQSNANVYASRMERAEPIIQRFESEGTSLIKQGLGNLPVVGNYLTGPDYQRYQQAKEDFLRAVLRKESGAVISDQEIAGGDRQYFPQPGDGPEVIAQKRQNRATAIQAIREGSGRRVEMPMPDEGPAPGEYQWTPDGGLQPVQP